LRSKLRGIVEYLKGGGGVTPPPKKDTLTKSYFVVRFNGKGNLTIGSKSDWFHLQSSTPRLQILKTDIRRAEKISMPAWGLVLANGDTWKIRIIDKG
jgi:hypothetical protein